MNNKKELVAVIPALFANNLYQSTLSRITPHDIDTIVKNTSFYIRPMAELDYNYKQLIAYIVITYEDKIFLVQRKSTCSEKRLANKYSIAVGGHLQENDVNKAFLKWGLRELQEEIEYDRDGYLTDICVINDNSNDVGKLHIGFVYQFAVKSNNVSLRSELKSGAFYSYNEIINQYNILEPWSQIILSYFNSGQ